MSGPSLSEGEEERLQPELPAAIDAVSVDLSAVEGLSVAEQRRSWALSLVIAFAAHVLVIAVIIRDAMTGPVGAGGTALEAVHVDLVTSAVLESRDRSASRATAAAPQPVDHIKAGAEQSREAAETLDQKQATADPTERTAGPMPDLVMPEAVEEKPPPEPSEVALAIAKQRPDVPDDKSPEPQPERASETAVESATASISSEPSEASELGGAAARGVDGIEVPEHMTAAASPGVASAYAQTVLETLARKRPRATVGVRGTVRIGFTVARSGEVYSARVVASSGQTQLDEAALEAVRSAKFPEPPPSLPSTLLSYEIPYIFR